MNVEKVKSGLASSDEEGEAGGKGESEGESEDEGEPEEQACEESEGLGFLLITAGKATRNLLNIEALGSLVRGQEQVHHNSYTVHVRFCTNGMGIGAVALGSNKPCQHFAASYRIPLLVHQLIAFVCIYDCQTRLVCLGHDAHHQVALA